MLPKIAALDLGSNSFHLAIAEQLSRRHFVVRERHKEKVQLGREAFATGVIDAETFERGLGAVRRLRCALDGARPAATLAVATSALREAVNGAEFVRHASHVLGSPVRIISGEEEARLVGLGTLHHMSPSAGRLAVFDLGGGSTEVVLASEQGSQLCTSLPVGTLRLRDGYRRGEAPTPSALLWLETHIRHALGPTLARVARARFDAVVLSCGSARDLARLARELGLDAPLTGGTSRLTAAATCRLQTHLLARDRAVQPPAAGADPGRVDTLLVAATVFKAIFAHLRVDSALVSKAGLRDGLVADYLSSREVTGCSSSVAVENSSILPA